MKEHLEKCNELFLIIQANHDMSSELRSTYMWHCTKVVEHLLENKFEDYSPVDIINCIDMALIVIGPFNDIPKILDDWHARNSRFIRDINSDVLYAINGAESNHGLFEVNVTRDNSIDYFLSIDSEKININEEKPYRLIGGARDSPAFTIWKDPSFIFGKHGHRLVPLELGKSYIDTNWKIEIAQLKDLILSTSSVNKYLAQFDLLSHIPQLQSEMKEPDLVKLYLTSKRRLAETNIWMGYLKSFSPLHYDPYDNIFVQIVGRKKVYLINPVYSQYLPLVSNLNNTSSLTLDSHQHPSFPTYSLILDSGDILFIPNGWWHQIESLGNELCVSVSYWFLRH